MASTFLRFLAIYYDTDLEMYYLQSRYYDPIICRFISPDSAAILTATPMTLTDKNLYAYCDNNPVTRGDGDGEFWHIIAGAAIGAAAGAVSKMIVNWISGEPITKDLGTAAFFGAISGALAASGVGLIGQVIGNAAIGAANDVADQLNGIRNGTNQEGFDIGSVLINGVIGGIAGFAGGPGAGNKGLTNIGLKNLNRTWDALTHKGVNAAIDVLGRGLTYFGKNARHMIKPLGKAIIKSSGSVIIGNTLKTVIS